LIPADAIEKVEVLPILLLVMMPKVEVVYKHHLKKGKTKV
jgi:hypothetical protein